MIRPTEWADYYRIAEMFLDWPMDEKGPCTPERTRIHMLRWFREYRSFVYEIDDEVVGCINVKGNEITHAVIHPKERNKGYFNQMTKDLAKIMIAEGVTEMEFEALDQSSFIANKYSRMGTRKGITGTLHKAKVHRRDF